MACIKEIIRLGLNIIAEIFEIKSYMEIVEIESTENTGRQAIQLM